MCMFFFACAVNVSILDFKEFLKALNPEINARSLENEDGSSGSGVGVRTGSSWLRIGTDGGHL